MSRLADGSRVRTLGAGAEWADGSEDRVLSILRAAEDRSSASDELAARIRDWPTRYHFSRLRSKVLSPLRIEPGMRVLDLGGGTGPISRRLGELGADVLLLDGSEARAEAAAARCTDLENVSVAVGTVFDLEPGEPFDVVLAIGLLEYAGGETDAFLRKAASLLAPGGVMAVAIENSIGLKYLLGYAEDHVGLPWVGWEGYLGVDHVRTYSRAELASILRVAGLTDQAWFYPFPDYKLPSVIVSDAAYELDSDVIDSIVPQPCTPDASLPFLLCDSRAAHRTMLRAGLGREIANSFVVVAGTTDDALAAHVDHETIAWLKGSERSSRFMRDRRLVASDGALSIVDDGAANRDREDAWLTQRRFAVVPFEPGVPLDRLVADSLAEADGARTRELLTVWTQTLKEVASPATSSSQAAATSPFAADEGRLALPGDYLDSQPGNFVHRDGQLHRIDTEWEVPEPIDFDLACVRGIFHFAIDLLTRGISTRRVDGGDVASVIAALAEAAGIEQPDRALDRLAESEGHLQALVRGIPADRAIGDVVRLLRTRAAEVAVRVEGPTPETPRREREAELEAELAALRKAHEAQARHLVAERLALAGQMEEEVGRLREEIEWRMGVMEHQEEQLEVLRSSRSLRYTEPLRRAAGLVRRR